MNEEPAPAAGPPPYTVWVWATENPLPAALVVSIVLSTLLLVTVGFWLSIRRNRRFLLPFCVLAPLPTVLSGTLAFVTARTILSAQLRSGFSEIDWPLLWAWSYRMTSFMLVGVIGTFSLFCIALIYSWRLHDGSPKCA